MGRGLYTGKAEYGGDLYRQGLALREEVLAKPIGVDFDESFTCDDEDAVLHACVTWEGEVVSTSMLVRVDGEMVKMRQVATAPDMRGLGFGARLMAYQEGYAKGQGYKTVQVPARCAARGFYEKTGYEVREDETFEQVGMPHVMMYKAL